LFYALQQPQLGAGRLLEMNTQKVLGTAMSQKPGTTPTRVFDETHLSQKEFAASAQIWAPALRQS